MTFFSQMGSKAVKGSRPTPKCYLWNITTPRTHYNSNPMFCLRKCRPRREGFSAPEMCKGESTSVIPFSFFYKTGLLDTTKYKTCHMAP